MSGVAKRSAQRLLALAGLEVYRRRPAAPHRATMAGVLDNAVRAGLQVATVVDVGAANGTPPLQQAFPDAVHLFVEPLEEFRPALDELAGSLRRAHVFTAAAGPHEGELTLNVHPDLHGSSTFVEHEDSDVNGVPRVVPQRTLDALVDETAAPAPYLVKVDTQGAELLALEGATKVLDQASAVLLEVVFFEFFEGGPRIRDVITWLGERGFVAYDLCDLSYRPLDGALAQVDILFVPADSPLQHDQHFATREQRDLLTEHLRSTV